MSSLRRVLVLIGFLALGVGGTAAQPSVGPALGLELSVSRQEAGRTGVSLATALRRSPALAARQGSDGRVPVVLTVRSDDALATLERQGVDVQSRHGRWVTARVAAEALDRVARMPEVRSIDLSPVAEPFNDNVAAVTGVQALRSGLLGGSAYTGSGTLVCIIDSGIDWDHLDFRDASNPALSRIVAMWNQTETPVLPKASPPGFSYGVAYSNAQINDELDGTPAGVVTETDVSGHGTHVAGTAAGNGASLSPRQHVGMAPDARLIVVKTTFTTTDIADGLTYCDDVATAQGQPVVANLSLGSDAGPHDGTDLLNAAATAFGQAPGRAAVLAAGNSGGQAFHVGGSLGATATVAHTITVPAYAAVAGAGNDRLDLDLWLADATNATLEVESPNGIVVTRPISGQGTTNTADGDVFTFNYLDPVNGDRRLLVLLYDSDGARPPVAGTWTVRVTNDTATPTTYDGWFYDRSIGSPAQTATISGADATMTAANTATGALVVGSWIHRWRWQRTDGTPISYGATDLTGQIAASSGRGPTRDGRTMPTLLAPGQGTASSRSSNASIAANVALAGGQHYVTQGTSMASPAVAGIVALMMQQSPTLTATTALSLLQATARADAHTGAVPNNDAGSGKVDAYTAMARLVNPASTSTLEVVAYDDVPTTARSVGTSGGMALRFTSPLADGGRMRGALVQLGSTGLGALTAALAVELWSDNSGAPGSMIGPADLMDHTALQPNSWSYLPLANAAAALAPATPYWLVLRPTGGTLVLLADGTGTGNSHGLTGTGPYAATPDAVDFAIRPVVTSEAAALPVELVAFEGVASGRRAALTWMTASETNNAGWAVETLGTDGETWRELRFVRGAGTSSETQRYAVETGELVPGTHRFRLRQMDLDGTATLSGVVTVEVGIARALTVALAGPNPSREGTSVVFTVPTDGTVHAEVVDLLGRRVATLYAGEAAAGRAHRLAVETSALGAGIYVVRIEHGGRTVQQRIAVAR